jgi:hypothetical protein
LGTLVAVCFAGRARTSRHCIEVIMKYIKGALGYAILLALPMSCDDTIDCFQICNTYSDCVTNIDVTECTDLCEDRIDDSANMEASAERCEECIDDRACAEIDQAGCFNDCPVVPVSD